MKNIAYEFVGDLLIIVQNAYRATDDEVERMLSDVAARKIEAPRTLVVTAGGSPTPSQRRMVNDMAKGRDVRIAIVSDKSGARMVALAAGLVIRQLKAFKMAELDEALAHLEVPPARYQEIFFLVGRLQREIISR